MSSLRNAVKRREHKERSQPHERKDLGLLEKHKDYVLRAKDYNRKKKTLQNMQLKAAFRNPDEFYFKMNNTITKEGVHQIVKNQKIGKEYHKTIQKMKAQDISYLHYKSSIDISKLEELKRNLHFIDVEKPNKHIIFLEEEKLNVDTLNPSELNKIRDIHTLEQTNETDNVINKKTNVIHSKELKKILKKRNTQYLEMHARMERLEKMNLMRNKLQIERNISMKGRKRKILDGDDTKPPVYVWKQQRKK